MPVKEGDRVRIVTREMTEEDAKNGMYYPHYANLTGTVQKVYSKQEVAIEIEMESLPVAVRKRHEEVRDQMKTKWLDGLSEEGRSRLTEREKDFRLRYVILTAMTDLEKVGARPRPKVEEAAPAEDKRGSTAPVADTPTTPRRTLAELEAAEEAELQRRRQNR